MLLQHIIDIIESAAPLRWQEAWDNSGLQVGEPNAEIHKALLTTDVTEDVVSEAIMQHCDLIVSHHPLLFKGLKSITGRTPQERIVRDAILHGIAIYSAHTSMDSAPEGVSGRMARIIGLTDCRILCPQTDRETGMTYGLGIIGRLEQAMPLSDLMRYVRERFEAPMLRYVGDPKQRIQTLALCGGAGAEFTDEAIRQGADAYLTADMKYHTMLDAKGRIALIDMDHWVSEHFTRDIFGELLDGKVETRIATSDQTPVKIYN